MFHESLMITFHFRTDYLQNILKGWSKLDHRWQQMNIMKPSNNNIFLFCDVGISLFPFCLTSHTGDGQKVFMWA